MRHNSACLAGALLGTLAACDSGQTLPELEAQAHKVLDTCTGAAQFGFRNALAGVYQDRAYSDRSTTAQRIGWILDEMYRDPRCMADPESEN